MVAYSFAPQFVEQVEALAKRQTVRAYRKRHARPGEAVQLYAGMRTRHCRKLVTPDPVCIAVQQIVIEVPATESLPLFIEIDGIVLGPTAVETFAAADGFGRDGEAAARMAAFWLRHHGRAFEGVLILWEPARA